MPANVEIIFYAREKPWYDLWAMVQEALRFPRSHYSAKGKDGYCISDSRKI